MNHKRIIFVILVLLLAACTAPASDLTPTPPNPGFSVKTPTPLPNAEGTASTFLDAWKKRDYNGMYGLLTPLSQDAIKKEAFIKNYTNAAAALTLSSLETTVLSSLQKDSDAEVLIRVTYKTALVGDLMREIKFPLRYENGRWGISWEDGLILPELKGGNTLFMDFKVPSRANIYDRNGLAFAAQTEAVAIGVIPGQITEEERLIRELATLLGRHRETIRELFANAQPDWYVPLGEVSSEQISARYKTLSGISGLSLTTYQTRYYLNGVQGAAHAVGYISSIPANSLAEYQAKGYSGNEKVGRLGLEAWGEKYLAGKRGGTLYVVKPGGQVAAQLARSDSAAGQAIYSTMDRELQKQAAQALGDMPGAAIVLNMNTGEVLAFASSPAFDPNLFDPTNLNSSALSKVLNDPNRPLVNRATQSLLPPGSVFKVVNVASGLISGLYERDSTYTCTGVWSELGESFKKYDWTVAKDLPPHGKINLPEALTFSCNPYNYHIAYEVYKKDANLLPKTAREFGLGKPTGIVGFLEGNNEEVSGLVPDADWKQKNLGEKWSAGDTVNMGIGQGYLQVTPLQIANIYAAIGNGGTLYRPQLVSKIAGPGETPLYEFKPDVIGKLPINDSQLSIIRDGMRGVITNRKGTAYNRFLGLQIPVYGKTGTAEIQGGGLGTPHAWFAGYTQANRKDKPDIAFVVLLLNRGDGSDWAAPVARRIIEAYFLGRTSLFTLYPWESEIGLTATPKPTGTPTPKP